MSFRKILLFSLLFAGPMPAATSYYDTYAAWGDKSEGQHGHLYLYTGAAASTDYFLYVTGTANKTINNLVQSQAGIGPYQPVTEYPNAGLVNGFGNSYFKLSSTNPMTWEVDENIICQCGEAHGFVAAADNNNSYRGQIFMTFLRQDGDPAKTIPGGATASDYGDDTALMNADSVPITVSVRKWTGAAWGAVLATSPSIPVGGVWMWAPDINANKIQGGTSSANQGHYRFDVSGGLGMLYKGNLYTPYIKPAWDRDNAWLNAPDVATGKKIGTDLIGAIVQQGGSPQIIVSNVGTAAASFDIRIFTPTSPGAAGTGWPLSNLDPSGLWTTVLSVPSLAVGASYSYDNTIGGRQYNSFARVVSTNGQLLEATMGTALTQSNYDGGDYYYAQDTNQAIGKLFSWGGFLSATNSNNPLEVHVVCPTGGTNVTLNAVGATVPSQSQTSAGPDCGLIFPVGSAIGQPIQFTLTSDQYVYVWAMSSTRDGGNAQVYGETFFSNPPTPQNLIVANKSVNIGTASIGDDVTYVLSARNIGAGSMLNTALWDTLPAGLSFVSSNPAPTSSAAPYYGWNLGTLPALQTVSVTVTAHIDTGFNGEIKHNHVDATAFAAPGSSSPDAPVRILIPGADLQKSVNVNTAVPGDSLTYTITYFNSAPALPSTPKFNLEVKGGSMDGTNIEFKAKITNYSGAAVNINDLKVCIWLNDASTAPSGMNFPGWYYGGTAPTYSWGGPSVGAAAFTVAPPIVRPDNRNASLQVCWTPTSGNSLPNGDNWYDISLVSGSNANAWSSTNYNYVTGNSYSRRPSGEGSYVNDPHFALYYQGNLVSEYTSTSTADPNTGAEPQNWIEVHDTVPAEMTYVGSSPAATTSGLSPLLTWFNPNVPPQQNAIFTFWGTVKGGTPGGTVIYNRADATANTLNAISNMTTVQVPIVGTLTYTPTITPTPTPTPGCPGEINYLDAAYGPASFEPRWTDGSITAFGFFPGLGFVFDMNAVRTFYRVTLYATQANTLNLNHGATISGPWTPMSSQVYSATWVPALSLYRIDISFTPVADEFIYFTVLSGTGAPAEIMAYGCPVAASPTPTPSRTASRTPTRVPTATLQPTKTPTPLPLLLHLLPNSPNPFGSAGTYIAYNLSTDAEVVIIVYDISGEMVRTLKPFPGKRGNNEQYWDGLNTAGAAVASGSYIYKVKATSPSGETQADFRKCAAVR